MDVAQFSNVLAESVEAGSNVLLRFEPAILDFTDKTAQPVLIVLGSGGNRTAIELTTENITLVSSLLQVSVLGPEMRVICWGLKNYLSFHRFHTGKDLLIDGSVVDLKILESYVGIKQPPPNTLAEALNRLKELVKSGLWAEVHPVYRALHLPLLTEVIPALETAGILDVVSEERKYAFYEIDGEANGRLLCYDALQHGFMPHTLGEAQRKRLQPLSLDEVFLAFDFKNMEVGMLQWLSGDIRLSSLLERPNVYGSLWAEITGEPENKENGKKLFLPVIYGQSALSLSKRLGVELPIAEKYLSRLHDLFPAAISCVLGYSQQAKTLGYAKDVLGKRRYFAENEHYLARNFSVQSPAAAVCLEKLIALHKALRGLARVVIHIHDEYVVAVPKQVWKKVFMLADDVLSAESQLCPGLRLKAVCHGGRDLNNLKPIRRKA